MKIILLHSSIDCSLSLEVDIITVGSVILLADKDIPMVDILSPIIEGNWTITVDILIYSVDYWHQVECKLLQLEDELILAFVVRLDMQLDDLLSNQHMVLLEYYFGELHFISIHFVLISYDYRTRNGPIFLCPHSVNQYS